MIYYGKSFTFTCVDPGLRGCGVAEFRAGELVRAAYVPNPMAGRGYEAHSALGEAVSTWVSDASERIIIEHPVIYPSAAQQKGDLNDLLDVVAVGASVASGFRAHYIESVSPREWKGQVPKNIMTMRIASALSETERANIEKCAAGLKHNVLDAVGIGLWKLGRINQRKIHND